MAEDERLAHPTPRASLARRARRSCRAAWAAPLAVAWGAATTLRELGYDCGLRRRAPAPLRVLSIGGLEVGGSGKTPLAGLLLAELVRHGVRCGLLTRGYGRARRGLVVRRPGEAAAPDELGDEPAMLVVAGCDVAVAACADRRRGAAALAALGCEVAVMDDGFAHRRLRRDLDVVVLRAEAPFGNGRYLPWGSLRAPPRALRRADAVVVYGGVGALEGWPDVATRARVHAALRAAIGPGRCLVDVDLAAEPGAAAGPGGGGPGPAPLALGWARARLRPGARATDAGCPGPAAAESPVVAAAGIARPEKFFAALAAAGVRVSATRAFADHHRYTPADVAALRSLARGCQVGAVAVTAKDAVKLARLWPPGPPFLAPWALEPAARLPGAVSAHLAPLASGDPPPGPTL